MDAEYVWIDLGNGRQGLRKVKKEIPVARSDLACPMVLSDQIETKSMVDGQTYTSKRALRESYRRKGYVEVGNEEQKPQKKAAPDRKGIRDSLGKAFAKAGLST